MTNLDQFVQYIFFIIFKMVKAIQKSGFWMAGSYRIDQPFESKTIWELVSKSPVCEWVQISDGQILDPHSIEWYVLSIKNPNFDFCFQANSAT